VIDGCATKCGGRRGSFVDLDSSDVDVALKGLSLFDCSSAYGAIYDWHVRANTSSSNLTSLKGEWGGAGLTGAVFQCGSGASTNGNFILFAKCRGGCGCFVKSDGSAVFRQCFFVGNSVGAIAHYSSGGTLQTRLESCYFDNTKLRGDRFDAGSVLVDSCLFAGEVQSAESFTMAGVQISFISAEISFDTASLLPLCGKYGKRKRPKRTGTPATWQGVQGESMRATRKARIIPFVVLQLALLALGFTL
jgi:hypothetical protein